VCNELFILILDYSRKSLRQKIVARWTGELHVRHLTCLVSRILLSGCCPLDPRLLPETLEFDGSHWVIISLEADRVFPIHCSKFFQTTMIMNRVIYFRFWQTATVEVDVPILIKASSWESLHGNGSAGRQKGGYSSKTDRMPSQIDLSRLGTISGTHFCLQSVGTRATGHQRPQPSILSHRRLDIWPAIVADRRRRPSDSVRRHQAQDVVA
jgi:hypothetical protein